MTIGARSSSPSTSMQVDWSLRSASETASNIDGVIWPGGFSAFNNNSNFDESTFFSNSIHRGISILKNKLLNF